VPGEPLAAQIPITARNLLLQIEPLDNPIWSCLTTRHAHLARAAPSARRYPASISPIGAVAGDGGDHASALEAVVEVGDDFAVFARSVPELPPSWETLFASRLLQMVRGDRTPLPEGDIDAVSLGAKDVPEMLALVELTKPGPFRTRTVELGNYIGIREDGRLIAMAGERLWVGDFHEVSAICTHPDAQRRGLARMLIARVANRILRAGETPFLHVEWTNKRAIDLYRALGFETRTELELLHTRRLS
jgi:ribosomal protein S18 acetylase RimI-like enzyme